jgi:hypothetical protein
MVSSTNETDRHDITEILLKVMLSRNKTGCAYIHNFADALGQNIKKDRNCYWQNQFIT